MIATFREYMAKSPEHARFLPFLIFVVITFFGGTMGGDGMFWLYVVKTIVGAMPKPKLMRELEPFIG